MKHAHRFGDLLVFIHNIGVVVSTYVVTSASNLDAQTVAIAMAAVGEGLASGAAFLVGGLGKP